MDESEFDRWNAICWKMLSLNKHRINERVRRSGIHMLRVSALHYSAGDWVLGGFRTVASACVLRQPTSCGSEYFYNQRPQVLNLIVTEHSLNRSECRVKNEAS